MFSHLVSVIFLFKMQMITSGIDPLATQSVKLNCFKPRSITGCSESFAEAYRKRDNDEVEGIPCRIDIFLFTRKNPNNPEFLHTCGGILPENTNYERRSQTIFYVHGFHRGVCIHAEPREMKDQLLYRDNYNVIIIDWSVCAVDVKIAIEAVTVVGKQIAFLVENIMVQTNTTGKMFHIVGHSYGAQIAGMAGQHMKKGKIRRITALDPGLPGFNVDDIKLRLDRSDAEHVDVIHSNADTCYPYSGDYRRIGHADFFPNGGAIQISGIPYLFEALLKRDVQTAMFSLNLLLSSHIQAATYFKTSANACDCQFVGVKCDTYEDFESGRCRSCGHDGSKCAVMGMDWEQYPRPKRGNHTYYLDVAISCPYCNNTGIDMQSFKEFLEKGKRNCWR